MNRSEFVRVNERMRERISLSKITCLHPNHLRNLTNRFGEEGRVTERRVDQVRLGEERRGMQM